MRHVHVCVCVCVCTYVCSPALPLSPVPLTFSYAHMQARRVRERDKWGAEAKSYKKLIRHAPKRKRTDKDIGVKSSFMARLRTMNRSIENKRSVVLCDVCVCVCVWRDVCVFLARSVCV